MKKEGFCGFGGCKEESEGYYCKPHKRKESKRIAKYRKEMRRKIKKNGG